MTATIAVACCIGGCAGAVYAGRHPAFGLWWYGAWAIICTVLSAIYAAERHWGWSAGMAVCAAADGILWWRNWRNRKRKGALARAGAKSRARIAALVAKQRQAARSVPGAGAYPRSARPRAPGMEGR